MYVLCTGGRLSVTHGKQKAANVARMALSIPQMKQIIEDTNSSGMCTCMYVYVLCMNHYIIFILCMNHTIDLGFPEKLNIDSLPKPKKIGGRQYPAGSTKTWREHFNKWLLSCPEGEIVVPSSRLSGNKTSTNDKDGTGVSTSGNPHWKVPTKLGGITGNMILYIL